MSEQIERYFYIFLVAAIAVLGWGLLEWNKAGLYQPETPVRAPRNAFHFTRKEKSFALERYQVLCSGDLFLGKLPPTPPPPTPVIPKVIFSSQLVVLGITTGGDAFAVVGTQKSGKQTWIARTGMVVEGEKVTQIKDGYIVVSNKTGTGKVPLKK